MFQITKESENKFLQENYNLADIRHPGQQRMLNLIKRIIGGQKSKTDIKKYIQEYQKESTK